MRSSFVITVVSVAVLTLSLAGAAMPGTVAARPTLVVVVLGSGTVASKPAGISCPGKCTATFAAGTRVLLTSKARKGARFLRWGGSCSGAGACSVRVSTLAAVAAQFEAGRTPPPTGSTTVAATPGSYSGQNGQNGNGFNLYVAPGGRAALNVSDPLTGLTCTPSGGAGDHLRILKTAIKPNGSFTATASQTGLFRGLQATFKYAVIGRFQAAAAGKAASAAGTWREDIVTSDASIRCTSNEQSWTATRSPGATLKRPVIEPGNYAGQNGQNGNGFSFSVAGDGKSMLNVSDPLTGLACTPGGGGAGDHLLILKVAIAPDGSFSAKTTQSGVLRGVNAKFTYTFAGYFEGPTSYGAATVAGTWREDIEFASGTTKMCTSNDQSWTATRSS